MSAAQTCPECGAPLPSDAPKGFCPKCLVKLGAEFVPSADSQQKTVPEPEPDILTERPGMTIGRYKLLQQIGEGGFGVVFMAEQQEPVQRKVALKVIKAGMDTREVIARFEAERQALALMDHPNIAQVLDGGTTSTGRPYFVMELVRGLPITDYCDQANLSMRERLELFTKVCRAVQHAHQKGVIHRDLKPSNVLVTLHDGEPVPKVIDFGVAKALGHKLTEKTLFTRFEQMIGTPVYMSPEQAALSGLDIDTRSDIYSLGVILYELLTGVTPLDARTLREAAFDEVRRMICETDPAKPSTRLATLGERVLEVAKHRHADPSALSRLIRGDLDWITMKALEKDRRRRYETVNGLAADVERHLRDEPVVARPPSALYRIQKAAQRHRIAFTAGAAVALTLVLGIIISTWQTVRAIYAEGQAQKAQANEASQRQRAERNAKAAEQNAAESRSRLVRQYVANGNRSVDEGDLLGALPWFAKALQVEQDPARAEIHRLRFGTTLQLSPRLLHVWFHKDTVSDAVFSPDGRRTLTASRDGSAQLWDVATGAAAEPAIMQSGEFRSAVFSPGGQRIALSSPTGGGGVWDTKAGQLLFRFASPNNHIEFSPDGRLLMTSSGETARFLDAFNGANVGQLMKNETPVVWAAFSRDGSNAVTCTAKVAIWRVPTGAEVTRLAMAENRGANYGEFSPDSHCVAIACNDGTAWVFDAISAKVITIIRHQGSVSRARFSPDSGWLLTASDDGTAAVWNATNGVPISATIKHAGPIMDACFSRDGNRVLTASSDGTAGVWDAATGRPAMARMKHAGAIVRASFSSDRRYVVTASGDHTARLWDLHLAGKALYKVKHPAVVLHASFSPDSRRALTVSVDGTVEVWNVVTGEHLTSLESNLTAIRHAAFSPDSRLLATASRDGTACVWDLATGQPVSPQLVHTGLVNYVDFSPDGERVVTAGSDRFARVWAVPSGRLISQMGHLESVNYAWFTPDGKQVLTVSVSVPDFYPVERWSFRLAEREALGLSEAIDFHPEPKWAFSLNEREAITANWGQAQIWDAATGQPVTLACKLGAWVSQVAVNPNRRSLIPTCSSLVLTESKVWPTDLLTGQRQSRPLKHDKGAIHGFYSPKEGIIHASYSSNGKWAVTASLDGSARIWDVMTGQPMGPPLLHAKAVYYASFSSDSRLVATGGEDRTARVWDAMTSEPVTPPLEHHAAVNRVFFSPDGRWLLTATVDGLVSVWELPTTSSPVEDELSRAELLAGHRIDVTGAVIPLSPEEIQQTWLKWQALAAREPATTPKLLLAAASSRAGTTEEDERPPGDTHPKVSPSQEYIVRAHALLEQHRQGSNVWPELIEQFSRIIEVEPDVGYGNAYSWRSRGYEHLGQYQKAVEDCRESVWRGVSKVRLAEDYLARARCYLRLGEIDKGQADLDTVIGLSAANAAMCNEVAWLLATGPRDVRFPEKALPLALRAVELGKTNHSELNTLGVVYYRLGQLTNAVTTLETGTKADKEGGSAQDFLFLAMSYERLGDSAKAQDFYDKGVKWIASKPSLASEAKAELESFRAEAEAVLGKQRLQHSLEE